MLKLRLAFKNGQKSAIDLDYVPLPAATVTLIGARMEEDHRRRWQGCVLLLAKTG